MVPDKGQTAERKQSLAEWRGIVETCAAFATAQGGCVYVGVTDAGQVVGVQIGKGTLEDLANKIAQNTNPRLVPRIWLETHAGQEILCVDVPENRAKPVYAFDQAYRRAGRTNQRLSPSEAAEIYFASRGVTWDETSRRDATIQDIDGEKVRQSLERAVRAPVGS